MSHMQLGRGAQARKAVCASAAAILAFSLVACAPEDEVVVGNNDKHTETPSPESSWGGDTSESSWGDGTQAPEYVPTAELPASFPLDLFQMPEALQIVDAGERGDGQWFVVVRVADEAAANALWSEVIETNGLSVLDEFETSEGGRSAELIGAALTVGALTIPRSDGSVQLNYELAL